MKKNVKRFRKQKKREKHLKHKKPNTLDTEITSKDRKFGNIQLIILITFVFVLLGFVISKIQ